MIQRFPHATFCWVELATADPESVQPFYATLFGWQPCRTDADDDHWCSMCMLDGLEVAGIRKMPAVIQEQGYPPVWISYVAVNNVDSVVSRVARLGGTVLSPGVDIQNVARVSLIQDPAGAFFGLWQAGNHIGARKVGEPNCLLWNELATRNLDAVGEFYASLLGWDTYESSGTDGKADYILINNAGRENAGMFAMTEEWGDIPSHWMPHFLVKSCKATTEICRQLGGNVLSEPFALGKIRLMAVLSDPQGAFFAIVQLYKPPDPVPEDWCR